MSINKYVSKLLKQEDKMKVVFIYICGEAEGYGLLFVREVNSAVTPE